MKCKFVGIIFLILCLGSGVTAEESTVSREQVPNSGGGWTMSPQAELALEKTYVADIRCIDHTYLYLKTGNNTYKNNMMNAMYDYDGTIDAWMKTLDNSIIEDKKATADRNTSFKTWNALNQTLIRIISEYEQNARINSTLLNEFENNSWNHLVSFDKLMSYIDDDSFDLNRSQIPLYFDLMKGCTAFDAYVITKNPVEKEHFSNAMDSFDDRMNKYSFMFPDISIENVQSLKADIQSSVENGFTAIDAGNGIPEKDLEVIGTYITRLDEGWRSISQ